MWLRLKSSLVLGCMGNLVMRSIVFGSFCLTWDFSLRSMYGVFPCMRSKSQKPAEFSILYIKGSKDRAIKDTYFTLSLRAVGAGGGRCQAT